MKKLLAILMSVVFAFTIFGVTGCGSSDTAEQEEQAAEKPAAQLSEEYTAFADAVDLDFAKEVNAKVASFGDRDHRQSTRRAGTWKVS